ncbi:substrate-binding periplasmic protein [Vibrio caribbeanicus]|uniref:substrate-binding periplasmic protein n=1 Tax=Vibrio caribbeanicus TaxID=701175 RepID=UPI002283CDB6|nr:transporter substrate-binding domain-containing protein [Vibrio caribbeanicus]MCY9844574.1 transporter substrate-binding domain-containing protein [Vibrio caribbeanicus]
MKTIFFLFFTVSAFSAASQTRLATTEYPPYVYLDGNEVNGVAVELIEYIYGELGESIDISVLPWGRALVNTSAGKVQGLFPTFKTSEREEFAIFMDEVLFDENIIAVKNSVSQKRWSRDNFKNLTLCLVNNWSYGANFDALVEQKSFAGIVYVKAARQCLEILLLNRVDFWVNNEFGVRYLAAIYEAEKNIHFEAKVIDSTPSYLAFSKKGKITKEEIAKLDTILKQMKLNGKYKQLIDIYFDSLTALSPF